MASPLLMPWWKVSGTARPICLPKAKSPVRAARAMGRNGTSPSKALGGGTGGATTSGQFSGARGTSSDSTGATSRPRRRARRTEGRETTGAAGSR